MPLIFGPKGGGGSGPSGPPLDSPVNKCLFCFPSNKIWCHDNRVIRFTLNDKTKQKGTHCNHIKTPVHIFIIIFIILHMTNYFCPHFVLFVYYDNKQGWRWKVIKWSAIMGEMIYNYFKVFIIASSQNVALHVLMPFNMLRKW